MGSKENASVWKRCRLLCTEVRLWCEGQDRTRPIRRLTWRDRLKLRATGERAAWSSWLNSLVSHPGPSTSGFSYDDTPSACVRNGKEHSVIFTSSVGSFLNQSTPNLIIFPFLSTSCLVSLYPFTCRDQLPPQMSHQMGGVPIMPPQPVMYNQPVLRPTNPFGPIPGTQVMPFSQNNT